MSSSSSERSARVVALHGRLLLAIATVAGVGAVVPAIASCRKERASPPEITEHTKGPLVPSSICGGIYPATEGCYAPFANARSTGTGEPAPAAPSSSYDKNGCLPKELVSNGCCNPAVAGPRFQNQECCYNFCPGPCCGRRFIANDGYAHVADVVERTDWSGAVETSAPSATSATTTNDGIVDAIALTELDPITRHALVHAWLADAQLEHASVAAFGRFVLDLIAVGAPPSLIRGAALAAADEVSHAEMCFAIARALGGAPLGPSTFPAAGGAQRVTKGEIEIATPTPTANLSLAAVVAEVIAEGCVGETIAALTASRQLEGARDPLIRTTLEQIAIDEARHAELAWSFVAWAIAKGGDAIRRVAADAFAIALRPILISDKSSFVTSARCVDPRVSPLAWRHYGRLSSTELLETRHRALADVIEPCARFACASS